MADDLELSLVDGGLSPAIAKVVANAITTSQTSQVRRGQQFVDSTPIQKMRLITSESRKYLFPNLDQRSGAAAFSSAKGVYQSPSSDHTYRNSQPLSASPTVSTPSVVGGRYMSASPASSGRVSQSVVGLNVREFGGRHARLNSSGGVVESVPIRVEVDQKDRLEAVVEERSDATVIRLRFRGPLA